MAGGHVVTKTCWLKSHYLNSHNHWRMSLIQNDVARSSDQSMYFTGPAGPGPCPEFNPYSDRGPVGPPCSPRMPCRVTCELSPKGKDELQIILFIDRKNVKAILTLDWPMGLYMDSYPQYPLDIVPGKRITFVRTEIGFSWFWFGYTITDALFYCDFENGLCGFRNGAGVINWKVERGSTPSDGTGPGGDHTHPEGRGKNHIFVRASA